LTWTRRIVQLGRMGSSKSFSVKSTYVSLRREVEGDNRIVYDKFWRCKALPSAHVTAAWRVLSNKIATRLQFGKARS